MEKCPTGSAPRALGDQTRAAFPDDHKGENIDETTTKLKIDEFEGIGDEKTIAEWRRLQRRSEIVHNRLTKENAFGYIDSGKVSAEDDIEFLVTDSEVGPIVYLVHVKDGNRQIIGDLNEPVKDEPDSESLQKLWDALEAERIESGKQEHTSKKFKTHAANIYAGFLKYNDRNAEGEVKMTRIEDADGAEDIDFYIAGTDPAFDDIYGTAKRGTPMVVVPRPGNDGMTRRVAVPVVTNAFTSDSVEARIIAAAVKVLDDDSLKAFLQHFLWCTNVTIFKEEVRDVDTGKPDVIYKIAVETRSASTKKGAEGKAIEQTITVTESGIVHIPESSVIRANVSDAILNGKHGMTDKYKKVASADPSIPETYKDFLKKTCSSAVSSFRIHNSWITINPLTINEDGTVTEEYKTEPHEKMKINGKGNVEVTINDPANKVAYTIEVQKTSDGVTVLSMRGGAYNSGMPVINVTRGNWRRMMNIMAAAVAKLGNVDFDDVNTFTYNGIQYEYYLNADRSVEDVAISEEQPEGSNEMHNLAIKELSYVARHYNGKNIDAIADEFFKGTNVSKSDLERLLKSIKEGKNSHGLDNNAIRAILEAHTPITELDRRVAFALKRRLSGLGIKFIESVDEGQRYVEKGQKILNLDGINGLHQMEKEQNISFFLDPSGTIVLGFAVNSSWKSRTRLTPEGTVVLTL